MQIEKLIEVAEELRIKTVKLNEELELANSKAYKETGIYSYSIYQNGFHVTEERFLEIANGSIFTIKERDDKHFKYQYEYSIDGILFFCITNHFWDFKKEENAEEDEPTTCMGCYHFEPKGGNLGYCEIQDHVISIEMGCDKWEPDKNV
jgi:hypothetical protein